MRQNFNQLVLMNLCIWVRLDNVLCFVIRCVVVRTEYNHIYFSFFEGVLSVDKCMVINPTTPHDSKIDIIVTFLQAR